MTTKRPDFNITSMNKSSGEKSGTIGVAWKNENGSINVKLNPGTALIGGIPDLIIRLWPVEAEKSKPKYSIDEEDETDFVDDDIPF